MRMMERMKLIKIIMIISVVAMLVVGIMAIVDSHYKTKAYEASLGTWQEAYESGTLISTKLKGIEDNQRVDSKFYDVTGDGIPDFEITTMWKQPYKWRYMRDGKTYG